MAELSETIYQSRSKRLGELLELDTESLVGWLDEDLKVIFQHQLRTPLQLDWQILRPELAEKLKPWIAAGSQCPVCYGDLFLKPNAPVELLELVKEFAKAHHVHPMSPLPREISRALYFTSIAAALAHRGQLISQLDPDHLQSGFSWALNQVWIHDVIRDIFRQAQSLIVGR
jgi:hypothetical protein